MRNATPLSATCTRHVAPSSSLIALHGWPHHPADYGSPGRVGIQEHEAAVAVDERGTVYYFYTAMNRLPYLVVSSDRGETWSHPLMIGPRGLTGGEPPGDGRRRARQDRDGYVGSTNAPGGDAPDGVGPELGRRDVERIRDDRGTRRCPGGRAS